MHRASESNAEAWGACRRIGDSAWRRLESIINFIETCYADTFPHGGRTPASNIQSLLSLEPRAAVADIVRHNGLTVDV
jgi:hypothetical protein